MTTTGKMVRVMIVAEHQHYEAYANSAKCILSSGKHILGMSIYSEPQRNLEDTRMDGLLFLQHYDRRNCNKLNNILR